MRYDDKGFDGPIEKNEDYNKKHEDFAKEQAENQCGIRLDKPTDYEEKPFLEPATHKPRFKPIKQPVVINDKPKKEEPKLFPWLVSGLIIVYCLLWVVSGTHNSTDNSTELIKPFNESFYTEQWVCDDMTDSDPIYCFEWTVKQVIKPEYRNQINQYLDEQKGED